MKIFLDTTFLMPLFGLETSINNLSKQFKTIIEDSSLRFMYSPISFIEIKWQIIKLGRQGKDRDKLEELFSNTLGTLKYEDVFISVNLDNPTINSISYELQKMGHSDYFDTVIGASAMITSDILLTEDGKLSKRIFKLSERNPAIYPAIEINSWRIFYNNFKSG